MTEKQRNEDRYAERYVVAKYKEYSVDNGKYCIIRYTHYDYEDGDNCGYRPDIKRAHVVFINGDVQDVEYRKLEINNINAANIQQLSIAMDLKNVLDRIELKDKLFEVNRCIENSLGEKTKILKEIKRLGKGRGNDTSTTRKKTP